MWKKVVMETVFMMNWFPLSGYSQYLTLSWVELHLPAFSPDGEFVKIVLQCITVSI